MSENIQDAVPQILQAIQRDIRDLRTEISSRFNTIEDTLKKQRRDTAGLLVMAKSLSGNFAEELAAIEERVSALEARDAR